MAEVKRDSRRDTRNIGSYILGTTLGEGAFGTVKVGTHIHTGEKVAIKILDKNKIEEDPDDIARVQTEIAILKKMRHKNIIQLYEIMESTKNIYLVMEYCEGKELFEYIVMKRRLPEHEALKFYQEIIDAVDYLHSQNIVHRDLKPENLLLDYKMSIKVSDFGLSRGYQNDVLLSTPCGTPSYAPPEMLKGEEYHGLLSDVWSSGVILYAMLCGYLPFSESNDEINCKKIIQGEFDFPDWLSESVTDLLRNILQTDPLDRYDIEQIKSHSWYNSNAPCIKPGLIIGYHKVPIDENILQIIDNYGYNKERARVSLQNNKFDVMTAIYYLSLRKFIKGGGTSISDLQSTEFLDYIEDENNLVSNNLQTKEENKITEEANCTIGLCPDENKLTEINIVTESENKNLETEKANDYEIADMDEENLKANKSPESSKRSSKNLDPNPLTPQSMNSLSDDNDNENFEEISEQFLDKHIQASYLRKSEKLSIRMAQKNSIFSHTNLEVHSARDVIDSCRNVINTTESNSNKQDIINLNLFKRNSIAITNLSLEKARERLLHHVENPKIKSKCENQIVIRNDMQSNKNDKHSKDYSNKPEFVNNKHTRNSSYNKYKDDYSVSETRSKSKTIGYKPKNPVDVKKNKSVCEKSHSSINKSKNNIEENVDNNLNDKTTKVKIKSTPKMAESRSATQTQRNISNNTSFIKLKSIEKVSKISRENNKSKEILKNVSKVKNVKQIRLVINNKSIVISNNKEAKEMPEQNRKNKFVKQTAHPTKIDSSAEKSTSKTPIRNLSFSPDSALKPQSNRVQVIPWNLKKKILDTVQEAGKKQIISKYEAFKKEKKDKKLLNKNNLKIKLKKQTPTILNSASKSINLHEDNTKSISFHNSNFNSNRKLENSNNSPYLVKSLSKQYLSSNTNEINIINAFARFKPVNKKVFVTEDANLVYLKTYLGPIDLSCIIKQELNITKINDKISEVLNKRRIFYVKTNPYKFRCSKNGTSFDIELFRLEEDPEFYYLKYKLSQGEFVSFRKLSQTLIMEISKN